MKTVLAAGSGVFSLFILTGCPIMMPFMRGPMMGKDLMGSGSKQVESVVQGLIQEGVTALAENRGQYERISLGQVTVKGDFIQETKFNQLLLDGLRSRKEWVVINGEKPLHHAQKEAEGNAKENEFLAAFVNAQTYQGNNSFHLAIEMGDSDTKQILWTGNFSRPMPQSSHAVK
jgi:hypothetical protein